MNRICIIDDSQLDRENITQAIKNKNPAFIIDSFSAWTSKNLKSEADLYILDIEIGEQDGFQVATEIKDKTTRC